MVELVGKTFESEDASRHLVDFSLFKAVVLFYNSECSTLFVNSLPVKRNTVDQNQMVAVQTKTPLRINVKISFTNLFPALKK